MTTFPAVPTLSLFQCHSCHKIGPRHVWSDDDEGYPSCGECSESPSYHSEQEAAYVSIALYLVQRVPGGPEDSGWFYEEGSRLNSSLRCFSASEWPQAVQYTEHLREKAEAVHNPKYEVNLAVRTYVDQVAPSQYPSERPTYR